MGKWIGIAVVVVLIVVGYSYFTGGTDEEAEMAPAATESATDGAASNN
ncbi:hypothetical protein [Aliiruegeria sabulilitoris]|nr:hypothetical protein [Aliiruegeria sabulilitoris]